MMGLITAGLGFKAILISNQQYSFFEASLTLHDLKLRFFFYLYFFCINDDYEYVDSFADGQDDWIHTENLLYINSFESVTKLWTEMFPQTSLSNVLISA